MDGMYMLRADRLVYYTNTYYRFFVRERKERSVTVLGVGWGNGRSRRTGYRMVSIYLNNVLHGTANQTHR
jgi:hypothetical protein